MISQQEISDHSGSPVEWGQFLVDEKLIVDSPPCRGCRRPMKLKTSRRFKGDRVEWRCTRCKRQRSIRSGSMALDHGKVPILQQMRLTTAWEARATVMSTFRQWDISRQTISQYFRRFRTIVQDDWQHRLEHKQVDFHGGTVECDCMTIVDCHDPYTGLPVPVTHIFGLVEVNSGRLRLFRVANQAQATLLPLILKVVPPGSMIFTDSHRAFWNIRDHPYFHYTVNHSAGEYSREEIDEDGRRFRVTTNHIEQIWARLRGYVRTWVQRRIDDIDISLDVFCSREAGISIYDLYRM